MLIHNIDVSDLLCNGALGILMGIELSKEGLVEKLIVKFDMQNAGKDSRDRHPGYSNKYPGGTAITKMDKEFTLASYGGSVGASTARLIQYPIVLAYAVTVHKIQGQTIEKPSKVCVDLRRVRNGGQAYVAASRIKELEQLYILEDLPAHKMYPNRKALEEIKRLEEISINNNPTSWDKESSIGVTKICFLNTRSLMNKFQNIKSDLSLQQSDIIILAETWIPKETIESDDYKLTTFTEHLNNCGRGKGLALFYRESFECKDKNEENINITKAENEDIDIISVYRSKEGSLEKLVNKLQDLINFSKTTIIIGDMNVCNREKTNNLLKKHLEDQGFKLIVNRSTHIDGGHIDHAYTLNIGNYEDTPIVEIIPKYYSDHDAICIAWKKKYVM